MSGPEGLLLIDKPAGHTSHDVVARVRRLFNTRRVGHAGTLDPQATGLLVLAVGSATRWLDWLPSDKSYRAEILFGRETDTQDAWGETVSEKDASGLDAEKIRQALSALENITEQVPPMVSALKKDGKRLYELAREGKQVERPPRPVKISGVTVTRLDPPRAEFELSCGSGTYVRTLCHDAGQALGTGACMTALRRLSVGNFVLAAAASLEALESAGDSARAALVDADKSLAHLPFMDLSAEQLEKIEKGQALRLGEDPAIEGKRLRLRRPGGGLAALAELEDGQVRPVKVFHR